MNAQQRPMPPLDPLDVPVHIIFVDETYGIGEVPPEGPSSAQLAAVASQIGPAEPTDIVVLGRAPWHPVSGELRAHPSVHDRYPQSIVKLSYRQRERAVWWSDRPFNIVSIEESGHFPKTRPSPAPSPFGEGPVTREELSTDGSRTLYVARSEPLIQDAADRFYKMSFTIAGDTIDPDMYCGF